MYLSKLLKNNFEMIGRINQFRESPYVDNIRGYIIKPTSQLTQYSFDWGWYVFE